jgi:NADP oxidoreductase coenzyme F420-dependent
MTAAIIGTGGIGSVIARQLASGGETLRLSSADIKSARTLAAEIGRGAGVAVDNRDALRDADAVVLALRFTVLKSVIGEIAESLTDKVVVVPLPDGITDLDHFRVRRRDRTGASSTNIAWWYRFSGTQKITVIVNAITGLMAVLRDADSLDKAEIYSQLGLRLIYHPSPRTVSARAEPGRPCTKGSCPRGDSPLTYMPALTGELVLGGSR